MGRNATEMERAVARTLRDSLEKLQRNTDEVNQAVGDLVSACSSARPTNTLPHLLRAQTSAASLAATLDVLSRFITSALQSSWSEPTSQGEAALETEPGPSAKAQLRASTPPAASEPLIELPEFDSSPELEPAPAAVDEALHAVASETAALEQSTVIELPSLQEMEPLAPEVAPQQNQEPRKVVERPLFDLNSLPIDQQELHRRANRVAKVSMQDIKMLRPADVRAGKENNDLCTRLRDDIERAHKEYERRFHAILDHPVDYFYAWMVEILGEGDPRALGKYPYPSTVARR